MSKLHFRSVIAIPGFRILWFNQLLMQLAINTSNFALVIWVFKLTGSNLAVSALILSIYLPALLFGIFAGVFVDISDRKRIIYIIDFLLAFSFVLFIFIRHSFPLILLNSFLMNSYFQFFIPAESSSIPMLVPKKQLFLANSLFSFTLYGALMVGFSLAGPALRILGINSIFYIGVALLTLAFLISQKLPSLKSLKLKKQTKNLVRLTVSETRETVNFVRGKLSVAVSIGLLSAIQGIIGILAVTVSSYMERVLRIHATDASLFVMLPLGLGMVTGALVVGRLFSGLPRRSLVIPSIIIGGILLFIIGAAPALARFFNSLELPESIPHLRYFFNAPSLSSTFALVAFTLGFCAVSIIIPSQTILQESTSEKNRGKIFSVLAVMMNAAACLPVLLAGLLADRFGATAVFSWLGIIVFVIGILALRPALFFTEKTLPYSVREFLGLGHWERR